MIRVREAIENKNVQSVQKKWNIYRFLDICKKNIFDTIQALSQSVHQSAKTSKQSMQRTYYPFILQIGKYL